ncbi:MAG TPA: T9SS type A sorting domain-containing protein, partial [Bacteroidota bacterium]
GPVVLPTSAFGPTIGNGNPGAEPYEGMLVRFNNVQVTDLAPVFSDPTEFSVDDGTGPVLVRRDGTHNYSNVAADTLLGRMILKLNDRISTFTGVMHYSFNRYKITPRRNDDFGTVTGVEIERSPERPATFALAQNYPNPFNPSTIIEYNLPVRESVTLKIYNILGQQVRVLVDGVQPEGTYKVRFDASSLPTGVYFYSIQAGQFRQVKRMLLLK